jgi:NADH-quinone oxidoreductase subunit N
MSVPFVFTAALPEIALAAAACLILIVDLFVADSRRQISYWLTQLSLLVAAWLTLAYPDETPLRALGGMFVADKLGDVLKLDRVANG